MRTNYAVLKNQIAFITEADDLALAAHGISSIELTVRKAQQQFNRWLDLEDAERKPDRLMNMLGFDYFKLLDLLTIAVHANISRSIMALKRREIPRTPEADQYQGRRGSSGRIPRHT